MAEKAKYISKGHHSKNFSIKNHNKAITKNEIKYKKGEYISRGFQGQVYAVQDHDDKVMKILKIKNINHYHNALDELKYSQIASELDIGPKIYDIDYVFEEDYIKEIIIIMDKVNCKKIDYTKLTNEEKIEISKLYKNLFNYSKKGKGFLPADFSFAKTINNDNFVIIDYGVTFQCKDTTEFLENLDNFLDCLDFLEPIIVNNSLNYYCERYNNEFTEGLKKKKILKKNVL
jgi:hypothetical protein